MTKVRERSFTWEDPMSGANQALLLSGMAYFEAIQAGEIPVPPIMRTLGFTLEKIEAGQAVFHFEPSEFHYNPIGTVHGGVISTVLDSAMGCTVHSLLQAGTGYTTLELKVNFLKPVTINTGPLKAVGKMIHTGSRTALVEAQLIDENNTIYAHGISTCMIFNIPTVK